MKRKSTNSGSMQRVGSYEIGHCKPPAHSRWSPGVSGNPAGKKPGSISLESSLRKSIRENPSKARDVVDAVIKRAIAGDMASAKLIFDLS